MWSPDGKENALQVGRYGIAGLINSVLGFTIIFGLQGLGVSPYFANLVGYVVGFFVSFLLQRKYVFASSAGVSAEMIRFVIAFLVAFAANQIALHALLTVETNAYMAQLCAISVYIVTMFILSKFWVFRTQS